MATGCPVVASSLPGVRSLVNHEHDGLLVPVGDSEALSQAIEAIVAHPKRRFILGQAGRKKVMKS